MITVKRAAKKLHLSKVRLRQLLLEGRIIGAQKVGRDWIIPEKPVVDPPLKVQHRRKVVTRRKKARKPARKGEKQ